MRVKAIEKMYYARREYKPGEIYEMDDREHVSAHILATLGKIEILKDEPKPQPAPAAQYETRDLRAEEPKPAKQSARPRPGKMMGTSDWPFLSPPGKGQKFYRRRDQRAE